MKKTLKSRLIKWGIIILSIVLVVTTLCFTLFTLREVRVEFLTTTKVLSEREEEIINSAGFKTNSCIFFQNKKEYARNIEKSLPYIEVVNIESVFPWTFIVHAAEREEYFEIEDSGRLLVTDSTMKVLKIEDEIPHDSKNIRLKNVTVLTNEKSAGTVLMTDAEVLKTINSAMLENNRMIYEQKGLFFSIEVGTRKEPTTGQYERYLKFIDRGGYEVVIYNAKNNLTRKFQKMFASLAALSLEQRTSTFLEVADLFDGGVYAAFKDK